jgi:hypothetical protein
MRAFGRNADWLRNIEATQGPEVVIGSQSFVAAHRFLAEEEALSAVTGYEHRDWFYCADHPLGAVPPARLAIQRLDERSPPIRRTAAADRVPSAFVTGAHGSARGALCHLKSSWPDLI